MSKSNVVRVGLFHSAKNHACNNYRKSNLQPSNISYIKWINESNDPTRKHERMTQKLIRAVESSLPACSGYQIPQLS